MMITALRAEVCESNLELKRSGLVAWTGGNLLASHLAIYRGRSDVRSVARTPSTFATAFAAVGKEISCVLTAIADELGGTVSKKLQAAVMVEDVARTVSAAMQIGAFQDLPADEIAADHDRYANHHGTINASQGVSR